MCQVVECCPRPECPSAETNSAQPSRGDHRATALLRRLLICVLSLSAAASAQTGSISGILETNGGKVKIAVVRATRVAPTRAPSVTATTNPDGTFTFPSLSAGLYQLCTTVSGGGYIDVCSWEPSGPVVSVVSGKTAPITLQVSKASKLKVHINDPAHLVQPAGNGKPKSNSYLVMGVLAPGGRFYPVAQTGGDGNGSDHEVDVPFDKRFTFFLKSVGLAVADSANSSVPASGISVAQQHSSKGPTPATLTFTIKGKS